MKYFTLVLIIDVYLIAKPTISFLVGIFICRTNAGCPVPESYSVENTAIAINTIRKIQLTNGVRGVVIVGKGYNFG